MANKGPDVNGVKYGFSSVSIDLLGNLSGVKSISYEQDLPGTKTYELGSAETSGRTRGRLGNTGSMTMYRKEYDQLVARLGDGYLEAVFTITVSYADIGQPTVSDKLVGCKLTKHGHEIDSGSDDALEVSLDLQPMRVFINGKKPLRGMRE